MVVKEVAPLFSRDIPRLDKINQGYSDKKKLLSVKVTNDANKISFLPPIMKELRFECLYILPQILRNGGRIEKVFVYPASCLKAVEAEKKISFYLLSVYPPYIWVPYRQ
jgi:hypothetical protein